MKPGLTSRISFLIILLTMILSACCRNDSEQDKPVFLYWGAESSPPCHAFAATVFRSPAVIQRSRLFVRPYPDGDLPNAHAAGERFGDSVCRAVLKSV